MEPGQVQRAFGLYNWYNRAMFIKIKKTGESKFWGEIKSLILDILNLRCLSHLQIEVKVAAGCLGLELGEMCGLEMEI